MQSVVGCLQQAPVRQIRSQGDGGLHALFVGTGEPVLLRGPAGVYVGVRLRYRVVRSDASEGPWEVRIVAYQYALLDREQREILAFHLHPDGASQVTAPHVHLGSGAGTL